MKKVLLLLVITIFSINTFAQNAPPSLDLSSYGIKINPDKRLITVLASLELSDLKTSLGNEGEMFRQELKTDLQKVNPELRRKIDIFVKQYKRRNSESSDEQLIAPFISMAYTLSDAPALNEPERSTELPDSLLEVLDYSVLVREFYNTPGVAGKIDQYYKKYQQMGDQMRPSAAEMVRELTAYLKVRPQLSYIERVPIDSSDSKDKKNEKKFKIYERERSFEIVPEMLISKGTINFLNVGDDYFAIVPPETNLSSSDVRRGYLQFVLDPLVLQYAREIIGQNEGIKTLLNQRREVGVRVSPDPFLAVSRSLVAAVDIREEEYRKTQIATLLARREIDSLKTDEEKRAVVAELNKFKSDLADDSALRLSESYENGAVLAFYFTDKLEGTENSGFSISSSLKDWIATLDPLTQNKKLEQYADARNRAAIRKTNNSASVLAANPLTAKLFEIDKLIEQKNYNQAETELTQLLNKNPSEIRIHYALGQVASLSAAEINNNNEEVQKRLQMALFHYNNVVRNPVKENTSLADRAWISLAYFAIGRIFEFYDERAKAVNIYNAAIKVGEVEGGAFQKASEAKARLMKSIDN